MTSFDPVALDEFSKGPNTENIIELSSIEKIPPEILCHIFSFLSNEPQQLLKMGAVSHTFRTLSSDNVLWKKFEPLLSDYHLPPTRIIRDSFITFAGIRKSEQKRLSIIQARRKQLAQGPEHILKSDIFTSTEKLFFILFSQRTAIHCLTTLCAISLLFYILQTIFSILDCAALTLAPILSYLFLFVIFTVGPKNSKNYADISHRTVDSIMTLPAFLILSALLLCVLKQDLFNGLNMHIVLLPLYSLLILCGVSVYVWYTSFEHKKK